MVGLSLDLVRHAIEKGKSVSVWINQLATRGPWGVSHVFILIPWVSCMADTVPGAEDRKESEASDREVQELRLGVPCECRFLGSLHGSKQD